VAESDATTVDAYLAELPRDRRATVEGVRAVILEHLPEGFTEGMQYGMIGYYIPLERYSDTYNGQPLAIAALANQKRYISLYLMGIYANDDDAWWFREQWTRSGKRLDMGKSCVRFRKLDDVPLDVVGRRDRSHVGRRLHRRLRTPARSNLKRQSGFTNHHWWPSGSSTP
jgi:Domain of unknown function (DU1801)